MPKLLLDKEKCLLNMEKMVRKSTRNKLSLRPHCKTHQSAEIASWFSDFGVKSITVSSFDMAAYFATSGWKDILVAFPFQPGALEDLIALSERCELSVLVDSPAALPFLNHIPRPVGFYIDIDTGYGRTGIRAENPDLIEQLIVKSGANTNLAFRGFYSHAGHSYRAGSRKEMNATHRKALADLGALKNRFIHYAPKVLFGDTPNCSVQEDFGAIDEITPGNFVFYDLVQHALGACKPDEIAVAMECPVAGRYPAGDRILVHGGAVHFSKDFILIDGIPVFGELVQKKDEGWGPGEEKHYLSSITQEHGIMAQCGDLIRKVNIGDNLLFLPVHSCLTANLMRIYHTLEGGVIKSMNC